MTDARPRRSALYLPAANARAIAKARTLMADVIILDLEDAVAPEAKEDARRMAVAVMDEGFGARERVVRVNALDTEWGATDLMAVATSAAEVVLAPKVRSGADVARYATLIGPHQRLWVMIETCAAIGRLGEIAEQADGVVLGTNDLALELGAREPGPETMLPYKALTLAAARAGGCVAVDGVHNDFTDTAGLIAAAREAARMGFDGKSLIHPSQVDPCNVAFLPSDAEIARARAIVAAFAAPEAVGKGAIRLEGRMVERLHLTQAERLLAMAER